jgi:hypothetical protein
MNEPMPCSLCDRPFVPDRLTRHHCLPRSRGGTSADIALLCRQCHGMVHATYTNATLALLYPTAAKLREAPELEGYLRWVRKQPPSRRKRNHQRRERL